MTEPSEHDDHGTLLDPELHASYLVHDRREIAQILQSLIDKRALVTAHLQGGHSFVTALLAVNADGEAVLLDASPDEVVNERATTTPALTLTTRLERIRLQFTVPAAERVRHADGLALRVPLPETLLRLQRREFFRLATPASAPLVCTIVIDDATGRKRSVPVNVLDISSGGIAVIVPPDGLQLAPGQAFDDCRLALPEGEPLAVRIRVRNLFQVERPNGTRAWRAGCQFLGLPANMTARIQRYIFKIERDRRARDAGF